MKVWSASVLMIVVNCPLAFAQGTAAFSHSYETASRVQQIEYRENLVVKIGGYANNPFVIEMPADEPIGDVALPPSSSYEMVKKGPRFFVRPLPGAQPATVLITTRSRSIVLDIVLGSSQGFKDRLSKLIVTLPAAPVPPPPPPAVERIEAVAAASNLAPETSSTYHNDNYTLQVVAESVDIRPREAFDDGRFTYLKFPNNQEIPAIFRSTPGTNDEVLVNSHRDGDFIVLHAVAPLWNLRLGGSVLGVFNESFEPDGSPPKGGTTVRGLERLIRQ